MVLEILQPVRFICYFCSIASKTSKYNQGMIFTYTCPSSFCMSPLHTNFYLDFVSRTQLTKVQIEISVRGWRTEANVRDILTQCQFLSTPESNRQRSTSLKYFTPYPTTRLCQVQGGWSELVVLRHSRRCGGGEVIFRAEFPFKDLVTRPFTHKTLFDEGG